MTIVKVQMINMLAASGEKYSTTEASGDDQLGREVGGWFSED